MRTPNFLFLSILCLLSIEVFAQKTERPDYTHYLKKGSKAVNVQLGIAGGYPLGSVTALDISDENKYYGLLVLPSYGSFVKKNFMIGASAILGFTNYQYSSFDYSSSVSQPPVKRDYKTNYSDFGIAPFARYYVQLSRRNVVNIFLQGSLPVFYSSVEETITPAPVPGSTWYRYNFARQGWNAVGSLGGGVSVNGRFGSLELNANNTGLYVGFQKCLTKSK
jgi:hypothetical protein